jgi:superfamily II DNA or RNA helicase
MYKLRPYQQEATADAHWHMLNYGKPFVVQAATGAGKSLIIAEVCKRLNEPVLVLQPTKELLEQNLAKLMSYHEIDESDIGVYSASMGRKDIGKFTYATIQSIHRKPELFAHFKYVIIDECHQVDPKNLGGMYTKFLDAIGCKNVCGLTATPYRLQQKFFKENGAMFYTSHLKMINRIHPFFWKNIICSIETADLIEDGYLCPITYKADEVDWDSLQINSTGADFTPESLEKFWTDEKMKKLGKAIQFIDKNCKRNLIFCSSHEISRAHKVKDMLDDSKLTEQPQNTTLEHSKVVYNSSHETMQDRGVQRDTTKSESEKRQLSSALLPETLVGATNEARDQDDRQEGVRFTKSRGEVGQGAPASNGAKAGTQAPEGGVSSPYQREPERQPAGEPGTLGNRDNVRAEGTRDSMPTLPEAIYESRVVVVSGKTPKIEREELVADYRAGKFKHMINVGVFTTGFDVPELDSIVLMRPTMSLALYYQMVGRGVRIDPANPNKTLHVFDFAGCVRRLGRVESIRLGKEDGYKDTVVSEVGRMDERPLFKFMVKKNMFARKDGRK